MNQNTQANYIKLYQSGNNAQKQLASNQLWQLNKHWISGIVGVWVKKHRCFLYKELVSVACIGFYEGVRAYQLSKQKTVTLKTYTVYWIRGALIQYTLGEAHSNFKVPKCSSALRQEIVSRSQQGKFFCQNELNKLAKLHHITPVHLKYLQRFYCDENKQKFSDIDTDTFESKISTPEEDWLLEKVSIELKQFIKKQPEAIVNILEARWHSDKAVPYDQLAKRVGGSPEKIRKIEKKALQDFRLSLVG